MIFKRKSKNTFPAEFGKGLSKDLMGQIDRRFSKIFEEAEKHGQTAVPLEQIELDALKAPTQILVQGYQSEIKSDFEYLKDQETRLIQLLNEPLDLQKTEGFFITEAGSLFDALKRLRSAPNSVKPTKQRDNYELRDE